MNEETFELRSGDVIRAVGEAFIVDRALGHGGMAAVYLCQQPKMGHRRVVLKILHARHAFKTEVREAFEREPQAMARIKHRSIVEIYDRGFTDDEYRRPFFIMEYISGESLRTILDRLEHLTPMVTTGVTMQILEGLHHLHKAGIVHCDIKPENIFVVLGEAGGGEAKLMDFGGIVFADEADPIAKVATPRYAAPEQLLGQRVTAKTDVFSMGVTLYELLTGVTPFQGKAHDWDACLRRADEAIPALDEHGAFPSKLVEAVRRMLSRSPEERPTALQALRLLQPIHRELERSAGDVHTRATVRSITEARPDESQPMLRSADFQVSTTPDPVNPALFFDGDAELGVAPTALATKASTAAPNATTQPPSHPLPAPDTTGLETKEPNDDSWRRAEAAKRLIDEATPAASLEAKSNGDRGASLRDRDGLPPVRPTPAPRIVLVPEEGRNRAIEHFPAVLGREPPSDVIFDTKGVSGTHAAIDYREGRYDLLDLGSTNGTHVEAPGGRVKLKKGEPYVLQDGDSFWIGPVLLMVRIPSRPPRKDPVHPSPVPPRPATRKKGNAGWPLRDPAFWALVMVIVAGGIVAIWTLHGRAHSLPLAPAASEASSR